MQKIADITRFIILNRTDALTKLTKGVRWLFCRVGTRFLLSVSALTKGCSALTKVPKLEVIHRKTRVIHRPRPSGASQVPLQQSQIAEL